ncbi:MAG TPA: helix-turn-helix domain-containing protein [Solirubrobacterales bacterium]|nr:helix-turn-helix domain-containing protein [Solirubrobacterales bacterium]
MASLPEHLSAKPAGRTRLSREVMLQHQRDRVLSVATEVFAKRGYNATTVDHIVSAAGIGVGTFYEFFENKEDCFLQAYERIVARGRQEVAAAISVERPWSERACAAMRVLLAAIEERPLEARLALVEVQTAGPVALARHEETLAAIGPFLAVARRSSPVAEELPATLETALVGGVLWFLQQRIVIGETAGMEALLPDLAAIVVEPYFGAEEAERAAAAALGTEPIAG